MSAGAPPKVEASQQHGIMASILPQLPASSVAAATGVQADAPGSGATEEAPRASTEAARDPSPEQAAAFSIEWDDWHPVEEWSHDPAELSQPVPELEDPDAGPVHGGHSLGDDVDPAHIAGCEPDLTPCKTATKGMQLDRWRP